MPLTSEKGRDYIRLSATIISLIDRFTPLAHYPTNPLLKGSPSRNGVREKVMQQHHPTYIIDIRCDKYLFETRISSIQTIRHERSIVRTERIRYLLRGSPKEHHSYCLDAVRG